MKRAEMKRTSQQINFKDFKKLSKNVEKGDETMAGKSLLYIYWEHWC